VYVKQSNGTNMHTYMCFPAGQTWVGAVRTATASAQQQHCVCGACVWPTCSPNTSKCWLRMMSATTSLRLSQRLSPSCSVSMRTLYDITLHSARAPAEWCYDSTMLCCMQAVRGTASCLFARGCSNSSRSTLCSTAPESGTSEMCCSLVHGAVAQSHKLYDIL
jgi:hypothetical protein